MRYGSNINYAVSHIHSKMVGLTRQLSQFINTPEYNSFPATDLLGLIRTTAG